VFIDETWAKARKEQVRRAALQQGTRRLVHWFPAIFDARDLNFGGLGDRARCGKEGFRGESFQNLEIQIAFHPDCGFNVGNESMEFEVEFTRRYPGEQDPRRRHFQNEFV
jgi:hypothetical protein